MKRTIRDETTPAMLDVVFRVRLTSAEAKQISPEQLTALFQGVAAMFTAAKEIERSSK